MFADALAALGAVLLVVGVGMVFGIGWAVIVAGIGLVVASKAIAA